VVVQDKFLIEWERLIERLPKSAQVIVAVSGGVDSMVLLHLVRQVWPLSQIIVAHFDHQVRPSSGQVSNWVKDQCRVLGISQVVQEIRTGDKTSEEALRNERYDFLIRTKNKKGAQLVLLAHHANDQLETFLMRLIRGSGVDGLSSMAKKRGSFVRPLLSIAKSDLLAFAMENQISFCEDETNQNEFYFRNHIRKNLVPILTELSGRYGGEKKFLERVGLLTEEMQEIRKENRRLASQWISTHVRETPVWCLFSRHEWLILSGQQKKATALKLWKRFANDTLETKELKLLDESIRRQKTVVLSGDIKVITSCGVTYLITPKNQVNLDELRRQGPSWDIFCRPGKKTKLKELLKTAQGELRFLEAGDRFNQKKMKRRCLDLLIPAPERGLLPVVAKKDSKDLIWHFPLSDDFLNCVILPWGHKNHPPDQNIT